MRQAGIIAGTSVYALRHHVDRLAEDHANARVLAEGLAGVPGIALNPEDVETNIVIFDISKTGLQNQELLNRFMQYGLRMSPAPANQIRAVAHLDVSRAQIEEAVKIVREVLQA